jgi:hypothetical protein
MAEIGLYANTFPTTPKNLAKPFTFVRVIVSDPTPAVHFEEPLSSGEIRG